MHAPNKTSLFQSLLMVYPYFSSQVQGMIEGFDPCQVPLRCWLVLTLLQHFLYKEPVTGTKVLVK